jgi:hypothetical protein
MLMKKGPNVFIALLGKSSVMMFLQCTGHGFRTSGIVLTKVCSNTVETGFATFNPSQLPHIGLFICALVPSLGCSMLKLALNTSAQSASKVVVSIRAHWFRRKRICSAILAYSICVITKSMILIPPEIKLLLAGFTSVRFSGL